MKIVLKYIGDGAFFPWVPARDLTQEDIAKLDGITAQDLVDSGLYAFPAPEGPSEE